MSNPPPGATPQPAGARSAATAPAPGTWVVAGGIAQGVTHQQAGLPCQDNVAWWVRPPGWTGRLVAVAALADGAGSASHSEVGSHAAVTEVVARAPIIADERQGPDLLGELFASARRAVETVAGQQQVEVSDLACTLLVAVITDDEALLGEVGDGVVAVRSLTGAIEGPLSPQRGEFANETTFITSGTAVPPPSTAAFPTAHIDAFALSSDGMRLLITANAREGTPHPGFFGDLFQALGTGLSSEELTRFLASAEDRTGDDKSLVAGVLRPASS